MQQRNRNWGPMGPRGPMGPLGPGGCRRAADPLQADLLHIALVPPARFAVKATAGARVVGKGGVSIKAIRADTGTKVGRLPAASGGPGAHRAPWAQGAHRAPWAPSSSSRLVQMRCSHTLAQYLSERFLVHTPQPGLSNYATSNACSTWMPPSKTEVKSYRHPVLQLHCLWIRVLSTSESDEKIHICRRIVLGI